MKLFLLLALFSPDVHGAPKAKYRTLSRGVSVTELRLPASVPLADSTDFDLTPKGVPVLLAKGRLYSSVTGTPLIPGNGAGVDGFIYQGNAILTSSQGKLGYLGETGLVPKVSLPGPGMKLTSVSPSLIAVHGGNGGGSNAVFLYKNDGTFKKYVEAGGTVGALTAREDHLIFSVRGTVYEVPAGKSPKVKLMIPGEEITSLAYSSYEGGFLFTTPQGVYLSSGGTVFPIVTGVTCRVRAAKDASFFALCPRDKKLMRIALNFSEIANASTEWKK